MAILFKSNKSGLKKDYQLRPNGTFLLPLELNLVKNESEG